MDVLSEILDEMAAAGNALAKAAEALKRLHPQTGAAQAEDRAAEEAPAESRTAEAKEPPASKAAGKTCTYEEVRQICAAKTAAEGGAHRREVLDAVKRYADGGTLSKVDPARYADLIAEVEAIGNAG